MDQRPDTATRSEGGQAAPTSPRVPGQRRNTMAEAIARVHGGSVVVSPDNENGVVRMKVVVSKQQLRQMVVLSMGSRGKSSGSSSHAQPPPASYPQALEQLLHVLRARHMMKRAASEAGKAAHGSPWTPALQSIPEEM